VRVNVARATVAGLAAVSAAGALTAAYALWEARRYTLREARVPVLAQGPELRLLHLSDLHLTGANPDRVAWVRGLADTAPDLVIVTGDFLSAATGIPAVQEALEPLLGLPGAFVLGSNDMYAAKPINPLKYLRGPSGKARKRERLDTDELRAILTSSGWIDLDNASGVIVTGGHTLGLIGTGDAHHHLDRYSDLAGQWPAQADLRIGVTHAPYLRVLDAMSNDGAQLILAGHTHGGQVCLPGYGALVTNCDLDTGRVKGLSRHEDTWLHVSAGLGTNPYAPVRLACPPEATLLTLEPIG